MHERDVAEPGRKRKGTRKTLPRIIDDCEQGDRVHFPAGPPAIREAQHEGVAPGDSGRVSIILGGARLVRFFLVDGRWTQPLVVASGVAVVVEIDGGTST